MGNTGITLRLDDSQGWREGGGGGRGGEGGENDRGEVGWGIGTARGHYLCLKDKIFLFFY